MTDAKAKPGVLWGRHRFHELARYMLNTMPLEDHRKYLLQENRLPGDERDIARKSRVPNDKRLKSFDAYLRINRLVLRARKFAENYPAQKPDMPFIFYWQQGIEAIGEPHFFVIAKTVQDGNYWNASNIWELLPKDGKSINSHALFLKNEEQKYLFCFMLAMHNPVRANELCVQLDVELEATQHLPAETRRLIFNLLATFTTF